MMTGCWEMRRTDSCYLLLRGRMRMASRIEAEVASLGFEAGAYACAVVPEADCARDVN